MQHYSNLRPINLLFSLVIVSLVITPLAPLVTATPTLQSHIQPALLAYAAEHPGETVRLIVQKRGNTAVDDIIAGLGGAVLTDLHIINALVAEVPTEAVPQLARAAGVRWMTLDAPVVDAGTTAIDTSNLANAYVRAVRADDVWAENAILGENITVAVVDSGIEENHADLQTSLHLSRVLANTKFNSYTASAADKFGHGTHVAGIIGGNGAVSGGTRIGVAPKVNFVNVKVSDDEGKGTISDVVAGLQWVYEHQDAYNIRVVNLALNSSASASYHESPLDAALEILWFNGIVVVVSAGNNGGTDNSIIFPPANDPFVITAGATDDRGTLTTDDDALASFSAHGTTEDGFAKPDLVAPGTNIVAPLASNGTTLAREHPDHKVDDGYFRMSGTSMSAAVTTGAVVLLLQDEPDLTPDQVKYRLLATAQSFEGPAPGSTGAGHLDAYAAVHSTTTESANTGVEASQLLWTGDDPVTWDSVNWNSVNWNSVNWNSVNWNSVNWNSVYWGD